MTLNPLALTHSAFQWITMKHTIILPLMAFLLLLPFNTSYGEDNTSALNSCAPDPVLLELEKQLQGAMLEYGFPDTLTRSFSLRGNLKIGVPKEIAKSAQFLSQKYSCNVICDIVVQDAVSKAILFSVTETFTDIGRTSESTRKYALGKVVRHLFNKIKESKIDALGFSDTNMVFKDLEEQEKILGRHTAVLSDFVDDIIDNAYDKTAGQTHRIKGTKELRREPFKTEKGMTRSVK